MVEVKSRLISCDKMWITNITNNCKKKISLMKSITLRLSTFHFLRNRGTKDAEWQAPKA